MLLYIKKELILTTMALKVIQEEKLWKAKNKHKSEHGLQRLKPQMIMLTDFKLNKLGTNIKQMKQTKMVIHINHKLLQMFHAILK